MWSERNTRGNRRACDAGRTPDTLSGVHVQPIAFAGRKMLAKVERHIEQVRRVEAKILRLHALEATHEQPGADEQHRTERSLYADEQVLRAKAGRCALCSAGAKVIDQVRASLLNERCERGAQAGHRRDDNRCNQHSAIRDVAAHRDIRQEDDANQLREPTRDDQTDRGAERDETEALDEELSREHGLAGTEGDANGEVAPASRRAEREQRSDVRGGDEQDDERYRREPERDLRLW